MNRSSGRHRGRDEGDVEVGGSEDVGCWGGSESGDGEGEGGAESAAGGGGGGSEIGAGEGNGGAEIGAGGGGESEEEGGED